MTAKKDTARVVGVGVAVCTICCAGPILAALAAIGLATAAGFVLMGTLALAVGAAAVTFMLWRRRRRGRECRPSLVEAVSVELAATPLRHG